MLADLVNLARDLTNLGEALRGARREKRDRLAAYLEQIGSCLDDAVEDLRAGRSAGRACAQLHEYVDLIPPTVEDAIGAERTARLRRQLWSALFVRGLEARSAQELDQMAEAAGALTALGHYLRASA